MINQDSIHNSAPNLNQIINQNINQNPQTNPNNSNLNPNSKINSNPNVNANGNSNNNNFFNPISNPNMISNQRLNMASNENPKQNIIGDISKDIEKSIGQDQFVIGSIADGGLKIAYQMILDLAYTLFIGAVSITITYDLHFRDQFISYVQEEKNKGFIIALIVLAVIILALNKSYSEKTSLEAQTKKYINFVEDIFRGAVFIVMLIFITGFVIQNYSQGLLVVAYILYIVSGSLFFTLRLMKWIYFLCGRGKDTVAPWTQQIPILSQLNQTQVIQLQAYVTSLINGKSLIGADLNGVVKQFVANLKANQQNNKVT